MERALELARRGWGRVAPNPLVGAVVLQGGKVVGEGAVPAFPGVPAAPLAAAPRWVPVERRALGSDTLLVLDRRLCLPES